METELNFLWGNLRKDNLSAFTVIAILQVESVCTLYSGFLCLQDMHRENMPL